MRASPNLLAGLFAMSASTASFGYNASADVTFQWATNGEASGWNASAPNSISTVSDSTFFTSITSGRNSTQYYNSDFATSTFHTANGCVDSSGGPGDFRAQYACKIASPGVFPVSGQGPRGVKQPACWLPPTAR